MTILESILFAGFMAILPPLFLGMVFIAPFWIWQFFFGRGTTVELPHWLDRSIFPIAFWMWVIGFGLLLWGALSGAFDS